MRKAVGLNFCTSVWLQQVSDRALQHVLQEGTLLTHGKQICHTCLQFVPGRIAKGKGG